MEINNTLIVSGVPGSAPGLSTNTIHFLVPVHPVPALFPIGQYVFYC